MRAWAYLRAATALALLGAGIPASANDTTAELATGGLVLLKTDDIEMRAEDLFISAAEIRVDYRFYNKAAKDKTVTVAFPMPDITVADQDTNIAIPTDDPQNILGFATTVDGQPVKSRVEQKVIAKGIDQTAVLRQLGIPLQPTLEATNKALDALPKSEWDRLIKLGLAEINEYDVGKGMEKHLEARWTLKTTYFWEQTFPAGRELAVAHRYKPSVGGTSGTMVGGKDFATSDQYKPYMAKYCLDRSLFAAVAAATKAAKADYPPFQEQRIAYILKTGANWAGPIKSFRLVVDKGSPDNLVSFCGNGVRKISATQFEIKQANFVPKADFDMLILTRLSPQ